MQYLTRSWCSPRQLLNTHDQGRKEGDSCNRGLHIDQRCHSFSLHCRPAVLHGCVPFNISKFFALKLGLSGNKHRPSWSVLWVTLIYQSDITTVKVNKNAGNAFWWSRKGRGWTCPHELLCDLNVSGHRSDWIEPHAMTLRKINNSRTVSIRSITVLVTVYTSVNQLSSEV